MGGFYFEAVPEVQLVRNRTVGRGFGAYVHSGRLKLRDFYGDIHLEPDAALIASGIINGDVTSYGNLSLTGTTALAISGDLSLQPSSTLSLDIRRDHAAGAIEVRGAAMLDGTLTLRSVKGSKRVISRRKRWVVINDYMGTKNRNHCNLCLWSKHVDEAKGDRRADCHINLTAEKLL